MLNSWKKVNLVDICEIVMGQSPKSQTYNTDEIGLPFMQGVKTFGDIYHSIDTWCSEPKKVVKKGYILMSVRAPVGKLNIAVDDVCIGRGLCGIHSKFHNNTYIYYYLKSISKEIQSQESGTVFGSINKSQIENIQIALPTLEIQNKIANVLSSLDNKIENNRLINEKLEETAQSIFNRWFVDFNFPDKDGMLYKDSGGEMIKSEFGLIPKGWNFDIVNNIFIIGIGKTPPRKNLECFTKKSTDIKWLSIADMGKSGIFITDTKEYLTNYAIKKYNVKIVPKNSVLLSFKLTVGRVAITREEITTNEAIAHFNVKNEYFLEYLYLYLKNYNYNSLGSTSSIANAINSKIVKDMNILIPNFITLNNFHKMTKNIFDKIEYNTKEIQNLKTMRNELLIKLLSGEIKI